MITPRPGKRDFSGHWLILTVALLAAAGLRLWHIDWGLPEIFEEATPLTVSWKFWNWGQHGLDFNPHFFHYPAFTFYLQFAVQVVQYTLGSLWGAYPTLESFQHAYTSNPGIFVILARLAGLLLDVGTIWITYLLVRGISNQKAALVTVVLLAVNPLHIKQTHLINVDTPLTLFVMTSLLFMHRLIAEPHQKWYILSGMSIGLAAATKFTGAVLLPVLLLAHLLCSSSIREALRSLVSKNLAISLLCAFGTFLLFNPYIVLDFKSFLTDFTFEQQHMSYGHFGLDESVSTPAFYFLHSIPVHLGWVFSAIVAMSIIHVLYRHEKWPFIAFTAAYLAIILFWRMRADRYLLPLVPVWIALGSIGLIQSWEASARFLRERWPKIPPAFADAGLTLIVLVVCFEPLLGSIDYQRSYALPDTRVLAKEWISEKYPKGAIVAMAPLGIDLKPPHAELPIPYAVIQFERYAPFYDTRWYEDVDLVVGSTFDYDRFLQDTSRYRNFLQFYDSLRSDWHLQFEIAPSHNQPGPNIWIYSPPSPAKRTFDQSLLDRLNLISSRELLRIFSRNVAGALYAKGATQKSFQILQKTALLDSSFAHAERSATLYDAEKFDDALMEIEKGLQYSPDNKLLVGVHAQVLLALNRLDEAEMEFQRSIALGEQSEPIYMGLAMTYAQKNEKEKAIEILTSYVDRLAPTSDRRSYIQEQIEELKSIP